jgi:hypothetical protein
MEVGWALLTGFLGPGMLNHLMGVGTQPRRYYLMQDSNNENSIMLIMHRLDNNINYTVLFLNQGAMTL